jgi:hypothetical protein
MAKLLESEFAQGNRTANVYKHSNGSGYTVEMLEDNIKHKAEVVREKDNAEDLANDWVALAPVYDMDDSTVDVGKDDA